MIVCPSCNQMNMVGAVFCSECGSALVSTDSRATQDIQQAAAATVDRPEPVSEVPTTASDQWARLHLLESGQIIPLADHNEFTIGRSSEGQSMMPDIDLSPYDAFSSGVSRLHAVIRRGISDISLADLDSANGTFINGKRILPQEDHALKNGDVIALGRLKIQILLKAS